jgi:lactate dehydrogenase-like 2-hydroxyacid dehydrogenase
VTRPRLLCKARFPGAAFERLGEGYDVEVVGGHVLPHLRESDRPTAIFTYRERIGEAVLAAWPQLRAIANYGVGVDRLDLDALRRHGVALVTPAGANAEAVADHAFGLLIALRHRIVEGDAHVRAGGFDEHYGSDVFGTTLGLLGLGAIGRSVARRARAFGMTVLYHARRAAPPAVEAELDVRRVLLDELLAASDAVSLHVPLTAETRGLIGAAELARMRPDAVLVNTARGAVCDEPALIEALVAGRIAGAALDVFADEPHVPDALRAMRNVVLTPHSADATWGTRAAMTAACVEGLLELAPSLHVPAGQP